jgi:hypothetical protein
MRAINYKSVKPTYLARETLATARRPKPKLAPLQKNDFDDCKDDRIVVTYRPFRDVSLRKFG